MMWRALGLALIAGTLCSCVESDRARETPKPPASETPATTEPGEPPASASAVEDASADETVENAIAENDSEKATAPQTSQPPEPYAGPPLDLLSEDEIRDGWLSLFDGKSLFGWHTDGVIDWTVDEGAITASQGPVGLLETAVSFGDFEFRCEAWTAEGGNSGIIFRSIPNPQNFNPDCYEFNLCDTHDKFKSGSLVGRAQPSEEIATDGRWTSIVIRAEGTHIFASLDGTTVLDTEVTGEDARSQGIIGLQKNEGLVKFRNIALKPLSMEPIFNGEDLSGWHEVPGSESHFSVVDGAIHVTNGRGFLETDESWKDFVLQADVKTNGENLNSGIFFRLMPSTEAEPSNGYEFQVHNGFKEGDRTQPIDHGTGAIFRRAPARWVVADDGQWLTGTLVATGPHLASWVDGYWVVDWTDEREPDENPRRGLRLEGGPISLQGHDPTTNLDFRNIKIGAIPSDE